MWANGVVTFVVLWVVAGTSAFLWRYRHLLRAAWCEPVLRRPVMVLESDDWGPGGPEDAHALNRIAAILENSRDSTGRPAVMTIGVVLAVADTRAVAGHFRERYVRRRLDDSAFAATRAALSSGESLGVFALQLHGMEHYWPPALMAAARGDRELQGWFETEGVPRTERLAAPLQTRWADCATLPSRPIDDREMWAAVEEEVKAFATVFGHGPTVVVPPTFVWTERTEQAWAANGLEVIVTPGRQYTGRNSRGAVCGKAELFWNGQHAPSGLSRVVRDAYFEPAYGHRASDALGTLEAKTGRGQPALFETHRFNFLPQLSEDVESAFAELKALLKTALAGFPQLVFMSTQELAAALARKDNRLVERSPWRRLTPVISRIQARPGVRKWALLSGAAIPGACLVLVAQLGRRRGLRDGLGANAGA